ncbi:NAD(P)/FAD-dependent oxidoreductase [Streptomyces sp. 549]|uniref:NAD(P)/FAD-dependent oxidoreductase n=1 Tax=Streptomyces sp. 549 TaxID=3049076 RepID=UPI0024C250F4|nr:NAD(P)/FAD-dependent oxidoreductase [Streptomyces sp. 549]MDK1475858.1 NAD(P)/FAD-dependent oxidoreductase [Streptomyces sp. 549]
MTHSSVHEAAGSPQGTPAGEAQEQYDVVVVGGGAAGLSAALILGRARRRVLVVDAGRPRNAPAAHMQGYLTRDGMAPADFLAEGRREVEAYGVRLVQDEATALLPDGDGEFEVVLADGGRVHARRVVVATGLVDELPDIPGLAERWGRDVLHCPYCHGWEVRDQPLAVLASPLMGAHQALLLTQWSKDVTLFLHTVEDLSEAEWDQSAAAGVTVVAGRVAALDIRDDRLAGLRLEDGTVFERPVLFAGGTPVASDGLLRALGADTTDTPVGPYPAVDATGRTTVPGVWAVGNATGPAEQVINAASSGYRAGTVINAELVLGDLVRAAQSRSVPGGSSPAPGARIDPPSERMRREPGSAARR